MLALALLGPCLVCVFVVAFRCKYPTRESEPWSVERARLAATTEHELLAADDRLRKHNRKPARKPVSGHRPS